MIGGRTLTVRGKVILNGKSPIMKPIDVGHCADREHPVAEESVLVDAQGGLKNAIVSIDGLGATETPAANANLNQEYCRFEPHILAVQTNQEIDIHSADATLHNAHFMAEINPPANLMMAGPHESKLLRFKSPEIVTVTCDVHPWMKAYVGVFENPYHAVTGEDGSFEIAGVPEGAQVISVWHERYGRLLLTVDPEKSAELKLEYKAP